MCDFIEFYQLKCAEEIEKNENNDKFKGKKKFLLPPSCNLIVTFSKKKIWAAVAAVVAKSNFQHFLFLVCATRGKPR